MGRADAGGVFFLFFLFLFSSIAPVTQRAGSKSSSSSKCLFGRRPPSFCTIVGSEGSLGGPCMPTRRAPQQVARQLRLSNSDSIYLVYYCNVTAKDCRVLRERERLGKIQHRRRRSQSTRTPDRGALNTTPLRVLLGQLQMKKNQQKASGSFFFFLLYYSHLFLFYFPCH